MPLQPHQHSYRAGRSMETALVELTDLIQKSLEGKETVACAFKDIEGSIDNTSCEAIRDAFEYVGFGRTASRWMNNLLATKKVDLGRRGHHPSEYNKRL